jgi:hypothetical protein
MATITLITGSIATLTTSALDSLATVTYVSAGTLNHTTNDPLDVLLQVKVTPSAASGNKQVVVFAKGSLDGTDFESGPESGTTTTDEPNLTFVGTVPLGTNSTAQIGVFSLAAAFGGVLPQQTKIIIKNDTAAGLAASGHYVKYSEVTGNSA